MRKLTHLVAASTLVMLVGGGEAHASRPFDGTDADVAEVGTFEPAIGPAYVSARRGRQALALPALVLDQGLFRDWELVVDARNMPRVGQRRPGEPRDHVTDTDVFRQTVLREGSLRERTG